MASPVARQPSPLNLHITHKFPWMFHIPYYLATPESVIIHLNGHFIHCWIYVIQFGMFRNGQSPPIFPGTYVLSGLEVSSYQFKPDT